MSNSIDRRSFIKEGAVFVSTALVSPAILLNQGCAVVSQAPKIWQITKALGGLAAALAILDYLGIKPDLNKTFSYREASQCLEQFMKDRESMFQEGMNIFIGINRSPNLRDVATMIGTNGQNTSVKISMQLKGKPSIKASNGELSAIKAATDFIKDHYKFPKNELGKAITLVKRENISALDENAGTTTLITRFINALGGEILYNPRPTGNFKQYLGTVQLSLPNYTDPKEKPFIALSA